MSTLDFPSNMSDKQLNSLLIIALLLAFLCVTLFQGTRGLYETTEGRYALCARETLHSGNLLEPILHGKHHWTKPPLTYIAIASGLIIFGDNSTWGTRFYLIPSFILTVLFVYLFAKNLWDKTTGVISALIYSVSPFLIAGANSISTDTLLVLWHSLTFFAFWKAYKSKSRVYIYLFWLALGLGCITKGPMGFIPLMGILPFCLWRWLAHKEQLWFFISPVGILLFLIVGISWYLWENYKYPGLLRYWLFDETVGRLAKGEFDRNPEWYKVFPIYFLPTILGTGFWIALLIHVLIKNKKNKGELLEFSFFEPQWVLLISSFIFPFLFFLISKSRLTLYILPVFIPLTVGMGRIFYIALEQKLISRKTLLLFAILNAVVIIPIKGVSAYYPNAKDMKELTKDIQPLINQFPKVELYCAKSNELNGFEFYTYIPVPEIQLSDEPHKELDLNSIENKVVNFLKETSTSQRMLLIPTKYENIIRTLKLPEDIKIHPVNKFWFTLYFNK